jgi:FkbM family methyltransferase
MNSEPNLSLKTANGWAILPSSLKRPDQSPRFNLSFPSYLGTDVGAQNLAVNESGKGYEPPTRNLIERTLRRGDLFVDVGAHWGLFTLQAATHPAGGIEVISFEPELVNALILSENVAKNNLTDVVTVICAACGSQNDLAPLTTNSTMGHSIRGVGLPSNAIRGPTKWVPVVTLDTALAHLQKDAERRVVLKIDAEGFEPQIIAGAKSVLSGGRVALIIWEWGTAFVERRERGAVLEMIAFLSACGFRHFQPPGHETDGPLNELDVDTAYLGNVFSFASPPGGVENPAMVSRDVDARQQV